METVPEDSPDIPKLLPKKALPLTLPGVTRPAVPHVEFAGMPANIFHVPFAVPFLVQ